MDQHAIDNQVDKTLELIKDFTYSDCCNYNSEKWQSDRSVLKNILTDHTLKMMGCEHEWFHEPFTDGYVSSSANQKKWRCRKCLAMTYTYD